MIALCTSFFYLTVLSLWLPFKRREFIWGPLLFISIVLSLMSHQLSWIALIPVGVLFLAIYFYIKYLSEIIILILGFGMVVAHKVPGFNNVKILDQVHYSLNAIPFNLYINLDKAIVGILLIGLSIPVILSDRDWWELFKKLIIKMAVIFPVILLLAMLLGFVRWDPKWPHTTSIFLVTNLLITCVAEEAFFRGFIQKRLTDFLAKYKNGHYGAILLASIVFGLAHFPGGIKYVVLATVAGIGYGWVYDSTKRIEGSILVHFGVNALQFFLFTYPALESAFK